MSLKLRFALLLGLLLTGFAIALAVLHNLERTQATAWLAEERDTRELLLNHWLDLTDRALPQLASDYAEQESLVRLAREPSLAALREGISSDLDRYGLHSAWLLDADGATVTHIGHADTSTTPPLAAADFKKLIAQTPSPRFFAEASDQLIEICVRRLRAPVDPAGAGGTAWLLLSRAWNQSHLATLAATTGGTVSIVAPSATAQSSRATEIILLRPLADWQGHALRLLRVDYQAPELARMARDNRSQATVFVVFGLLILVALWLALQAWVLRPLGLIGASLAQENRAVIEPLHAKPDELGGVARLITLSFQQRDDLKREIEERARAQEALQKTEANLRRTMDERTRLGRDLHDGVIQSLYAAGMGLTSIRSQLNLGQTEAAARLEQTRAALNETIHDLRNFINGLEPESLKMQSFTQAVTALLEVVQGLRPLQTAVSIDETLAYQLTLAQRVHALQIAREAVSNALRHGDATRVTIALRSSGESVEFEVTDNGRGFDPATAPAGHGLGNFTERAHELGGQLTVTSMPGQGTRVRLVFSLLKTL